MNNLKDSYKLLFLRYLTWTTRKRREPGGGEGEEESQTNEAAPGAQAGRGDTRRSCSVDNQTLYCLSYIRRQHCKNPVKKRGNSRSVEVAGRVCNSQKRTHRRDRAGIIIRKKANQNILAK